MTAQRDPGRFIDDRGDRFGRSIMCGNRIQYGVDGSDQCAGECRRVHGAEPLRRGQLTTRDLARVQRRRSLPTIVAQRSQRGEHDMLLRPALAGTLDGRRLPMPLRALRRIPALRGLTAYLGGIGIRPEHAPPFAYRAPKHLDSVEQS
ncbi:hypothetical protein ACIHDR_03005 [Nocardia sp. NPDC052278]|uniref:hypothetical protein n=1 Tax=unclassified Nocardia TaxID=2637762 RepID=UPI0036A09237